MEGAEKETWKHKAEDHLVKMLDRALKLPLVGGTNL